MIVGVTRRLFCFNDTRHVRGPFGWRPRIRVTSTAENNSARVHYWTLAAGRVIDRGLAGGHVDVASAWKVTRSVIRPAAKDEETRWLERGVDV